MLKRYYELISPIHRFISAEGHEHRLEVGATTCAVLKIIELNV